MHFIHLELRSDRHIHFLNLKICKDTCMKVDHLCPLYNHLLTKMSKPCLSMFYFCFKIGYSIIKIGLRNNQFSRYVFFCLCPLMFYFYWKIYNQVFMLFFKTIYLNLYLVLKKQTWKWYRYVCHIQHSLFWIDNNCIYENSTSTQGF